MLEKHDVVHLVDPQLVLWNCCEMRARFVIYSDVL